MMERCRANAVGTLIGLFCALLLTACQTRPVPPSVVTQSRLASPLLHPVQEITVIYVSTDLRRVENPKVKRTTDHLGAAGYDTLDRRVARLTPEQLRKHGLNGSVELYPAAEPLREALDRAALAARNRAPEIPRAYWLILRPRRALGAVDNPFSLDFELELIDPATRVMHWHGAYTMITGGADDPIDDADVTQLLDRMLARLVAATRVPGAPVGTSLQGSAGPLNPLRP